jgi:protein-S-isoprenylcysteine O-methyltransferase Ste14
MSSVEALNSNDITRIGVIVIVALVLVGALLSIVITALVGRLIILVVVVVLGVLVWQQRTHLKDQFDECKVQATFFGVHFDAPQSLIDDCRKAHKL